MTEVELGYKYMLLGGVGLAAGFVDSIAGGGGLLTLPSLLWAGLTPQWALGTNKLQASCGTALATYRYAQAGLLRHRGLKLGIAITLLGSLAGSWVAYDTSPQRLRVLIPILLLCIGVYLGKKPNLGKEPGIERLSPSLFAALFGVVLGFYDGFFGPGTGSFWMTACMTLRGMDYRAATGYTKAMNLTSNLASMSFFLLHGKVHWPYALAMTMGQLVGAQCGSRVVIRDGDKIVRPVLRVVVFALAAKLLLDLAR